MTENRAQEREIDLTSYLDVVLRRRWVILSIASMVFIVVTLITYTAPPVYQARALLVIEKERGWGAVYSNGSLVESRDEDYYQTQYKLLQSLSLMRKVHESLKLEKEPDFFNPRGAEKLQSKVTIFPVVRSRLVYVQVRSHDPGLAARVANAISETFVQQNLSNQLFISKDVLQALQLNQHTPQAQSTYEALPAVVSNSLIQGLKGEYAKQEALASEMSRRFTPSYPGMIAIRSRIATLKERIQVETEKIVQSLKTELSGQLNGNNVRIIDPAQVPDSPIEPRKRLGLMMGIVGGLALGLGVAFLIELLDQSIRTQEDVESKLRLPFLGQIPFAAREAPIYRPLLTKEPSLTSESLRNLRTMIDFASVSHSAAALLVTSAVQGEGKTYVASNLAVVFAQMGAKVLLIDGDLRRASAHKAFRLSSGRGMTGFLASGQNAEEARDYLQNSEIPNLQVLVCGPRPPNPSEMLNTPRLGALIGWARANFDRVIVDCTPMFPINDTLLWGRHIKAGIFIARYGKTRVPLMLKACQKLQTGGINILGVAINSATPKGFSYSSYGYHYQQYYQAYHQEQEAATNTWA